MKLRFFSPFHKQIERVLGWFPMFFVSWSRNGLWTSTDPDGDHSITSHNWFSVEYMTSTTPGDPPCFRLILFKLMLGVAFAKRP
jgi:hypothetical protein